MKIKGFRLITLFLVVLFCLDGCGASVTELTSDEENRIAYYAADVISKFNKRQGLGIVPVVMEKEVPGPEETPEEDPQNQAENTQNPTGTDGSGGADAETGSATSLTDIVGIPGVSFITNGIEVIESYIGDGYAVVPRSNQNRYLVLNIKATNTTGSDIRCDIASRMVSLQATLNTESVKVENTFLENDFVTYNESIGPNKSVDLVMLFEFSAQAVSDISNLTIIATKNGIRQQVAL